LRHATERTVESTPGFRKRVALRGAVRERRPRSAGARRGFSRPTWRQVGDQAKAAEVKTAARGAREDNEKGNPASAFVRGRSFARASRPAELGRASARARGSLLRRLDSRRPRVAGEDRWKAPIPRGGTARQTARRIPRKHAGNAESVVERPRAFFWAARHREPGEGQSLVRCARASCCIAEVGVRRFRPVKPRRVTSLIRRGPTGWPGTQLEACPSRRKARAGSARVKKRRAAAPSAVTSRSRDRRRIAKMRSPAGGRRLGPWKHRSFHEGDVEAVNGGPQGSRGGVRGSIGSTPRKRKRQARGRERPGRNRPIRRSVVGVVKRQ
jgi:hypothetical protein